MIGNSRETKDRPYSAKSAMNHSYPKTGQRTRPKSAGN